MPKSSYDPARIIAANAEAESTLSFQEMRERLVLRWPLLLVCILVMPLVAALLTSLVPPVYKSTCQLLIRHENGSAPLLDSAGKDTTDVSAPASAELIRTVPVVSRMIETVGVTDADVARPAYKVLFRYVFRLIAPLLPKDNDGGVADPALSRSMLAKDLKDSIKVTTLQTDVRPFGRQDELIEINVSSTNAQKVAQMATALCEAFITEHNLRSEKEAQQTYDLLVDAENKTRAKIKGLAEQPLASGDLGGATETSERSMRSQPLTESLARHVADLQLALVEARRVYGENSAELARARRTLEETQAMYGRQEALDGLNSVLASVKQRQREALLNLELARKNQTGLSIVEPALPPKVTSLVKLMRYAVPVGVSGVLGAILGLGLIVVTSAIDEKVRSRWDVEPVTGATLLGQISKDSKNKNDRAPLDRAVFFKILNALEAVEGNGARVLDIVTAGSDENASDVALRLARELAASSSQRVLLVDGNFEGRHLSTALANSSAAGMAELLRGSQGVAVGNLLVAHSEGFRFLPAGKAETALALGFVKARWVEVLAQLKSQADIIVIDGGSLHTGRVTHTLANESDLLVLAVQAGVTRVDVLESASDYLRTLGRKWLGTLLFFSR
ncbi:MAG TPA: hypothetical protein VFT72_04690 [Opitutaceae bacterium]|nr:hypothetical protein [Opitutaceae bacterium]